MAPGTLHKGNNGSNSNSRGRSFGLMLLLAFGAALFGVMVIHKLRERRIFNLLVQEKDRNIISLQLLLQKEKSYSKEMKMKIEEINAKLNSLQNQKMELDGRLLEMHSIMESMKDEHKVLESTLDEKQNEIKWLKERDVDSGKRNSHLIALMETLKQKEAEIKDLKHRMESWSASSDPSKPIVILNESRSTSQDVNLTRGELESKNKSIHVIESVKSSGQAAGWDNGVTVSDQKQTVETQFSNDNVGTAEEDRGHELQERNLAENGSRVQKFISNEGSIVSDDDKDLKITTEGKKRELGNSREGETGQLDVSSKGDVKMEIPNKFRENADLKGKTSSSN